MIIKVKDLDNLCNSYPLVYDIHHNETIITFEEDGRFGNLLLETATLIIIGKKINKPVQLMPQEDI